MREITFTPVSNYVVILIITSYNLALAHIYYHLICTNVP